MISLIYKIMGDINPFKKAVTVDAPAAAAKGGSEAGKFMGAQFKSAMLKYIGAGAILGFITKLAGDAARIVKDAAHANVGVEAIQELQKAADKTGLSLDELKEKAMAAPKEFAAFMKSIREAGGILSKEDVENFAKLDETMTSIKSKGASFLVSIVRAGKFMNWGGRMGPQGTPEMDRTFRKVWGLPPDETEEGGPKSPGQVFKDAVARREAGREAFAQDMKAVAGLVQLGLGISNETAKTAGLVSKSTVSTKTIDDVVKAIQDVDKTLKTSI